MRILKYKEVCLNLSENMLRSGVPLVSRGRLNF